MQRRSKRARRLVSAALVVGALLGTPTLETTTAAATDDDEAAYIEPELAAEAANLTQRRVDGSNAPMIAVELLTDGTQAIEAAVRVAGGTVTGVVPGEVVQAVLPAARLSSVASIDGIELARTPRRVNQWPQPNFGPTVGQEVATMNADDWHTVGMQGADVRVGIIDYFDMTLWDPSEHGAEPSLDNGRMFCRDTTGFIPSLCLGDGAIDPTQGLEHGVAVAEIVKDVAPQSIVYIASVGTVSDLLAAVNWFADNDVHIITRSLGSAWDGPGDGTGPLGAVVDAAAARGIVWFNSAGNEAVDHFMKRTVPTNLGPNRFVDFDPTAGVDTWLRIDRGSSCFCVWFDGLRWANDWYLSNKTDYSVEFWQPTPGAIAALSANQHTNPTSSQVSGIEVNPFGAVTNVIDGPQFAGADPLEASDLSFFANTPFVYVRVKRNASTPVGATPDTIEIALAGGQLELGYAAATGSAGGPVVDSRNPSLLAVGAVDILESSPGAPTTPDIAYYSSQGPTADGRIKPDIAAPACFYSTIYSPTCFAGTSAASPAAAGMAALLLGQSLAEPGPALAALVRHLTTDRGSPGPDNAFGAGEVTLPSPPDSPTVPSAARYVPAAAPVRVLDTRPASMVGPANLAGPHAQFGIIDLQVAGVGTVPADASAVAVNITSTDSLAQNFVQAIPTLQGSLGSTSTLNVALPGSPRPNFAIVDIGDGGRISVYLPPGGNVIIDLLGYFAPTGGAPTTDGRFVAIEPERWMDTREAALPPGGVGWPRKVSGGESAIVIQPPASAIPIAGVAALVLNVTATDSLQQGHLRAEPTGATGLTHSTVNYLPGTSSANTVIIPLGADGTVSVFALRDVHVVVDVTGYITAAAGSGAASTAGLFVPITSTRTYDSRLDPGVAFAGSESRGVPIVTPATAVPIGSAGVVANLTVTQATTRGFLRVFPTSVPSTSNVNYSAGQSVANGALVKISPSGGLTAQMSAGGHVIVDIIGYFTGSS